MTTISSTCHEENDIYDDDIPNEYEVYKIGKTSCEFDPAKEKIKNMLFLVAYDIRTPKRLAKVAKTCVDFGIRVEYSVFECDLCEENFLRLWNELAAIIDHDEDCILAYRICGRCVTEIQSMGAVVRPGKPLLYIM